MYCILQGGAILEVSSRQGYIIPLPRGKCPLTTWVYLDIHQQFQISLAQNYMNPRRWIKTRNRDKILAELLLLVLPPACPGLFPIALTHCLLLYQLISAVAPLQAASAWPFAGCGPDALNGISIFATIVKYTVPLAVQCVHETEPVKSYRQTTQEVSLQSLANAICLVLEL